MLVLNAEQIRSLAPTPRLIEALRKTFARGRVATVRDADADAGRRRRSAVRLDAGDGSERRPGDQAADHPAGEPGEGTADSAGRDRRLLQRPGVPVAILDGTVVTHLRTGAASALASQYLSREDSSHLVIAGHRCAGADDGCVALRGAADQANQRMGATTRAGDSDGEAIRARVPDIEVDSRRSSIEEAVATADIVACSTSSPTPILEGKWLQARHACRSGRKLPAHQARVG